MMGQETGSQFHWPRLTSNAGFVNREELLGENYQLVDICWNFMDLLSFGDGAVVTEDCFASIFPSIHIRN